MHHLQVLFLFYLTHTSSASSRNKKRGPAELLSSSSSSAEPGISIREIKVPRYYGHKPASSDKTPKEDKGQSTIKELRRKRNVKKLPSKVFNEQKNSPRHTTKSDSGRLWLSDIYSFYNQSQKSSPATPQNPSFSKPSTRVRTLKPGFSDKNDKVVEQKKFTQRNQLQGMIGYPIFQPQPVSQRNPFISYDNPMRPHLPYPVGMPNPFPYQFSFWPPSYAWENSLAPTLPNFPPYSNLHLNSLTAPSSTLLIPGPYSPSNLFQSGPSAHDMSLFLNQRQLPGPFFPPKPHYLGNNQMSNAVFSSLKNSQQQNEERKPVVNNNSASIFTAGQALTPNTLQGTEFVQKPGNVNNSETPSTFTEQPSPTYHTNPATVNSVASSEVRSFKPSTHLPWLPPSANTSQKNPSLPPQELKTQSKILSALPTQDDKPVEASSASNSKLNSGSSQPLTQAQRGNPPTKVPTMLPFPDDKNHYSSDGTSLANHQEGSPHPIDTKNLSRVIVSQEQGKPQAATISQLDSLVESVAHLPKNAVL